MANHFVWKVQGETKIKSQQIINLKPSSAQKMSKN